MSFQCGAPEPASGEKQERVRSVRICFIEQQGVLSGMLKLPRANSREQSSLREEFVEIDGRFVEGVEIVEVVVTHNQ